MALYGANRGTLISFLSLRFDSSKFTITMESESNSNSAEANGCREQQYEISELFTVKTMSRHWFLVWWYLVAYNARLSSAPRF